MRAILTLALALPAAAQTITVPCEAPAATLRVLETLPPLREGAIPFEQRVGALRKLAAEHPEDFFLQRAYQDSFRRSFYLADEYDRALEMYRRRNANPLARYYEARLLMMVEPARSKATMEGLMQANPKFVWPHLDFLEWTGLPGRRDTGDAATHWKAFLAVCPAPLDGYFDTALLQDAELVSRVAKDLREGLERRNTPLDWEQLPRVWNAERRAGVAAEPMRVRVRADVERIEKAPFRPVPELSLVYREAAGILAEPGLPARLRERVMREAPDSTLAYYLLESEWAAQNPRPGDLSGEAGQAYQKKREAIEREWAQRWPNAGSIVGNQWNRVSTRILNSEPGAGSAEDLAALDGVLRALATSPDIMSMSPPMEISLARLYVRARVRLEQVPRLLDAGLSQVEKLEKYRISSELMPAELKARATDFRGLAWAQTEEIRAEYLLAVNRTADARAIIEAALDRLDTAPPTTEPMRRRIEYDRQQWFRRLGDADAQDGNVESALSHYQKWFGAISKETLERVAAREPTASIRRYYLAHGGTPEKWLDWATAKSPAQARTPAPPQFVARLPEFSAKDLAGRAWSLRDLQGKATFVNFWATWCGPCRGEHPAIEKLFQSLKAGGKLQVLTISVDADAATVRRYMQESGYHFPVIHSPELADKLFPYVGLPTNLLVNTEGRRTGMYGFGAGDVFLERLRKDLESAAR
jgi:thiol-disulfide isomerase/thioredoxin